MVLVRWSAALPYWSPRERPGFIAVRPVGGTVPTLNPIQRHTIVTEEARLALVEMARVWTRLADDALLRAQPEVQQQLQPKEGGDTQ